MTHTDWLVTLNDEQPSMTEGLPWRFWWTTQRDRATGEVRRRGDGKPYTPLWRSGDDVFVRYAGTERVIAWLILDSEAHWTPEEEWFETDSTVHVLDPDGPTLADIGIARAVQGGRQRLNAEQRTAAVAALADSAAYRFGQAVEAAARRAVANGWPRGGLRRSDHPAPAAMASGHSAPDGVAAVVLKILHREQLSVRRLSPRQPRQASDG